MSEPKTREEIYLNAIANGETPELKPITREEMFLAKAGGQDIETPKPITRREIFLSKIKSGGSSGEPTTNKLASLVDGSITEITAEDLEGATAIKNRLFEQDINLINVTIPLSVKSIGYMAFFKCEKLKSLDIGDGVTSIGNDAFNGCNAITELRLGNSLENIGSFAFNDCQNIQHIIVPNSVTMIDNQAFRNCYSLRTIRIGNGVTNILYQIFQNNKKMTDIYIDAPEDSISGAPWGAQNSPTIHWNTPLPTEED